MMKRRAEGRDDRTDVLVWRWMIVGSLIAFWWSVIWVLMTGFAAS